MLVTSMRAEFYKKAAETIIFECHDGKAVRECVDQAISSGEGKTITMISEGKNSSGELLSKLWIEWSFKKK